MGVRFASTGTIPLSVRSWADSSTVTVADPFRAFGFVTEARAGGEKGMSATYRHLYEIAAEGSGSRITYTLTQLAIARPMLRVALPGVREMTWSLAIPMFAGRGVRNLAALAEERSGTRSGTEVMAPPRAL